MKKEETGGSSTIRPLSEDTLHLEAMSPGKAPTLARAATLADVAQFAGVSSVAVSVVLNKSRSKVRVSEATRQRILEAAQELNYQPNALARSLMSRSTNIIGFYNLQNRVFDPLYPFYGAILRGLFEGCENNKKNLLVHGTFYNASENEIYLELLNGQIDGLVLFAREITSLTQRLATSHLPVVTVADKVPGLPCVTIDDNLGGRLQARHLIEKGHKQLMYWYWDTATPVPSTVQLRLQGFQEEAQRHGAKVEVVQSDVPWPLTSKLQEVLSHRQPPLAIAAFNDILANFIVSWCRDNAFQVPEDVAVIGYDGLVGVFGEPTGLTTIQAPWAQVAETAVSLLVQQCSGKPIPLLTQMSVEVLEGKTT